MLGITHTKNFREYSRKKLNIKWNDNNPCVVNIIVFRMKSCYIYLLKCLLWNSLIIREHVSRWENSVTLHEKTELCRSPISSKFNMILTPIYSKPNVVKYCEICRMYAWAIREYAEWNNLNATKKKMSYWNCTFVVPQLISCMHFTVCAIRLMKDSWKIPSVTFQYFNKKYEYVMRPYPSVLSCSSFCPSKCATLPAKSVIGSRYSNYGVCNHMYKL